jgi:hypothetical protein
MSAAAGGQPGKLQTRTILYLFGISWKDNFEELVQIFYQGRGPGFYLEEKLTRGHPGFMLIG